MKTTEQQNRILDILHECKNEVLKEWRANDGGLTWAADDAIKDLSLAQEMILDGNIEGAYYHLADYQAWAHVKLPFDNS